MSDPTPTWAEMLAEYPQPVIDVLTKLAGKADGFEGVQVLLTLSRPGHPSMLLGFEGEGYEPEDDADLISRGGVGLIAQERQRQISEEGRTAAHDAEHRNEDLAMAAVSYALPAWRRQPIAGAPPNEWPWYSSDWKPTPDDRVRELVKAGALIAAEIDRLIAQKVNG